MFDSILIPPGGVPIGFILISTAGILGISVIVRSRRGTKKSLHKGGLRARTVGSTVTAKYVATSYRMAKDPYLILRIEFCEDGSTHKLTEPVVYKLTLVDKVRRRFVDHGRYGLDSYPNNWTAPLKIAGPAEEDRAERTIANGCAYELTLEEPFPISVFKRATSLIGGSRSEVVSLNTGGA